MSRSLAVAPQHDSDSSIDDFEQQLLALGTMPRRDEEPWDAAQWERYVGIVRELVALLSSRSTGSCPRRGSS
jgi:hypothetical protein